MKKLKILVLMGVLVAACIGLTSCMFTDDLVDNAVPVASFNTVINALSVTFDGSHSDDVDSEIVSWKWYFGDGEVGGGETVTHAYDSYGTYLVRLVVTDEDGASGEIANDIVVEVVDVAPTAEFWLTKPDYVQTDSWVVSFNAKKSHDTPPGEIVTARWEFGDGSPAMYGDWTYLSSGVLHSVMREARHTYVRPNYKLADDGCSLEVIPYIVKLTVWDNDGNDASITHKVWIRPVL